MQMGGISGSRNRAFRLHYRADSYQTSEGLELWTMLLNRMSVTTKRMQIAESGIFITHLNWFQT